MTLDDHPTSSSLQLAKALHPASSGRRRRHPQDRQGPETQPFLTPSHAGAEVLAVLWDQQQCRAQLESMREGWLSCETRPGRRRVTIAAVEGDDLLLSLETWSTPGHGEALRAPLEVEGVTTDGQRWLVRASGPLRSLLPAHAPPSAGHPDRAHPPADPSAETCGFTVLALTVTSVRGFERRSGTRPSRRSSRG